MKVLPKAGAWLAVVSLLGLLVNDWWAKAAFHNALTGKLSDVAGLFGLPFLLGLLLPRRALAVHLGCAALFVLWKSELAQPALDYLNDLGLPVHRTVDYTDYVALLGTGLSYALLRRPAWRPVGRAGRWAALLLAGGACVATSMPARTVRTYAGINKDYAFAVGQAGLVARLNRVQTEAVNYATRWGVVVAFDQRRHAYYLPDTRDTLAVLLDYRRLRPGDTLHLHTALADVQLTGDDSTSLLRLLSLRYSLPPADTARRAVYQARALRQFEKRVISQLRQPH